MTRRLQFIATMVFLANYAFGQIGYEIESYVDSTELLVQNGRKMMLVELNETNDAKVREIYSYLTESTKGEHYSAFYYLEDFYINLILNDWETINHLMLNYDQYKDKILYPDVQELMGKLNGRLQDKRDDILFSNKYSNLDSEAKRLVELILHFIDPGATQDEYNNNLKLYRKQFKESQYTSFVDEFLPNKVMKGSFSYSFGSGMVLSTRELGEVYSNSASVNMGMDINVHKVFTSLYLNASSPKLKEPFMVASAVDTMAFEVGESFSNINAGLKAGYFLFRGDRFNLAPYVSISGTSLTSNRYTDPEDNDLEYKPISSFTYGAGLHAELKIYEYENQYPNYYGYPTSGYFSIKFETGYNRILKFDDPYVKGDNPYFICALVVGFGQF